MAPRDQVLGPLELERVAGRSPGAPRHRLLTQGSDLRARGLVGLAVCQAMGKGQGSQGCSAWNVLEERRGVQGPGGWGQGGRVALEMVQGALEAWGPGARQVTGMGRRVLGTWGR